MTRIALVTGAGGQDGSLLCELLVADGTRVLALERSDTHDALNGVEWVTADLRDAHAVANLVASVRPDEIYHLAAAHHASQDASQGADVTAKEAMIDVNFRATQHLAFAMLATGVDAHLVFAASSQVHTASLPREHVDESRPRKPSTFYGLTKSWSMDLLAHLRVDSGLRASSAVLFNHESTRRPPQFVTRKVTIAAARAARGLDSKLSLRNLGASVDWSSAQDVVEALRLMARAGSARDYVVASGEAHTVRELLGVAFGHVGLDWRDHVAAAADIETPFLVGCPKALERDLGWQRRTGFASLVREMVDADLAALDARSLR
jgi:GDPmannose 4,6-dehydratase